MIFRAIILLVTAIALIWSLAEWRRTPATHPEYPARGDRTRLLILVLLGLAGEAARSRLENNPLLFLWCTVALAPVALAALYFIRRLYLAYRRSASDEAAPQIALSSSREARKP